MGGEGGILLGILEDLSSVKFLLIGRSGVEASQEVIMLEPSEDNGFGCKAQPVEQFNLLLSHCQMIIFFKLYIRLNVHHSSSPLCFPRHAL